MDYMSTQEAAIKWGVTKRRVQFLCESKRIDKATRVGSIWLIPINTKKPTDNRVKNKRNKDERKGKNLLRITRNEIKPLAINVINKLVEYNYSYEESKRILVSIFAYELLNFYVRGSGISVSAEDFITKENRVSKTIFDVTGINPTNSKIDDNIYYRVQSFIGEFSLDCDDALSWCYQFANKMDLNSLYSDTQFFTEKYMVAAIVDSMDITSREKIIDPACGGGNFLIYSIDSFCKGIKFPTDDKEKCKEILQSVLDVHIGYEIDSNLALVASINLRFKCINILFKLGYRVLPEDFEEFTPKIFYPTEKTIGGALDIRGTKQKVSQVGASKNANLTDIFRGCDAIITNPPFQTIKGMKDELKQYLKENYPLSKCDMCNAFIEVAEDILETNGVAGMVTQNSWMYLDSFIALRKKILSSYSIDRIWELGSNAFYNLSGEKANVTLTLFRKEVPTRKQIIKLASLKSLTISQVEELFATKSSQSNYILELYQMEILSNFESRFDMISSKQLRELTSSAERYGDFAIPMQGTSTGNAKKLIDYFWRHNGNKEWVLVSKGGGYSRWIGLNHYCVKWGKDGKYVREQKGSAIRNANYFDKTQMVFSDTGTAGLSVRELQKKQIFVASGPGIRIKEGKSYAHMAFLNSRYASYYIRLFSPKLTISAGYIAKIPVYKRLLCSDELDKDARICIEAKRRRLSKRPFNFEFSSKKFSNNLSVEEHAYMWFQDDIQDEWEQLTHEELIDQYVYAIMGISDEDRKVIDNYIGKKMVYEAGKEPQITLADLKKLLEKTLDYNCNIMRTKSGKNRMGCDGILEYLSQITGNSCETIYWYLLSEKFYSDEIRKRYEDLLIHACLMTALDYLNANRNVSFMDMEQRLERPKGYDADKLKKWIKNNFNEVHTESFLKTPIFFYNRYTDEFELIKDR